MSRYVTLYFSYMNLFLSPYYELKGLLSGDLTSVFRMNTRFLSQLA